MAQTGSGSPIHALWNLQAKYVALIAHSKDPKMVVLGNLDSGKLPFRDLIRTVTKSIAAESVKAAQLNA